MDIPIWWLGLLVAFSFGTWAVGYCGFSISWLFIPLSILVTLLNHLYRHEKRKCQTEAEFFNLYQLSNDQLLARKSMRNILGFLPLYFSDINYESLHWASQLLTHFYPFIKDEIESRLQQQIQKTLNKTFATDKTSIELAGGDGNISHSEEETSFHSSDEELHLNGSDFASDASAFEDEPSFSLNSTDPDADELAGHVADELDQSLSEMDSDLLLQPSLSNRARKKEKHGLASKVKQHHQKKVQMHREHRRERARRRALRKQRKQERRQQRAQEAEQQKQQEGKKKIPLVITCERVELGTTPPTLISIKPVNANDTNTRLSKSLITQMIEKELKLRLKLLSTSGTSEADAGAAGGSVAGANDAFGAGNEADEDTSDSDGDDAPHHSNSSSTTFGAGVQGSASMGPVAIAKGAERSATAPQRSGTAGAAGDAVSREIAKNINVENVDNIGERDDMQKERTEKQSSRARRHQKLKRKIHKIKEKIDHKLGVDAANVASSSNSNIPRNGGNTGNTGNTGNPGDASGANNLPSLGPIGSNASEAEVDATTLPQVGTSGTGGTSGGSSGSGASGSDGSQQQQSRSELSRSATSELTEFNDDPDLNRVLDDLGGDTIIGDDVDTCDLNNDPLLCGVSRALFGTHTRRSSDTSLLPDALDASQSTENARNGSSSLNSASNALNAAANGPNPTNATNASKNAKNAKNASNSTNVKNASSSSLEGQELESDVKRVFLDLELAWAVQGFVNLRIALKRLNASIPLSMHTIYFRGRIRLGLQRLEPMTSEVVIIEQQAKKKMIPPFRVMTVSFLEIPKFDFEIAVGNFDGPNGPADALLSQGVYEASRASHRRFKNARATLRSSGLSIGLDVVPLLNARVNKVFEKFLWPKMTPVLRFGPTHNRKQLTSSNTVCTLEVRVVSATGLRNVELVGTSDPYCVVEILGRRKLEKRQQKSRRNKHTKGRCVRKDHVQETGVEDNDLNPVWNENFEFGVSNCLATDYLRLSVWDYNSVIKDRFMGETSILLKDVRNRAFNKLTQVLDMKLDRVKYGNLQFQMKWIEYEQKIDKDGNIIKRQDTFAKFMETLEHEYKSDSKSDFPVDTPVTSNGALAGMAKTWSLHRKFGTSATANTANTANNAKDSKDSKNSKDELKNDQTDEKQEQSERYNISDVSRLFNLHRSKGNSAEPAELELNDSNDAKEGRDGRDNRGSKRSRGSEDLQQANKKHKKHKGLHGMMHHKHGSQSNLKLNKRRDSVLNKNGNDAEMVEIDESAGSSDMERQTHKRKTIPIDSQVRVVNDEDMTPRDSHALLSETTVTADDTEALNMRLDRLGSQSSIVSIDVGDIDRFYYHSMLYQHFRKERNVTKTDILAYLVQLINFKEATSNSAPNPNLYNSKSSHGLVANGSDENNLSPMRRVDQEEAGLLANDIFDQFLFDCYIEAKPSDDDGGMRSIFEASKGPVVTYKVHKPKHSEQINTGILGGEPNDLDPVDRNQSNTAAAAAATGDVVPPLPPMRTVPIGGDYNRLGTNLISVNSFDAPAQAPHAEDKMQMVPPLGAIGVQHSDPRWNHWSQSNLTATFLSSVPQVQHTQQEAQEQKQNNNMQTSWSGSMRSVTSPSSNTSDGRRDSNIIKVSDAGHVSNGTNGVAAKNENIKKNEVGAENMSKHDKAPHSTTPGLGVSVDDGEHIALSFTKEFWENIKSIQVHLAQLTDIDQSLAKKGKLQDLYVKLYYGEQAFKTASLSQTTVGAPLVINKKFQFDCPFVDVMDGKNSKHKSHKHGKHHKPSTSMMSSVSDVSFDPAAVGLDSLSPRKISSEGEQSTGSHGIGTYAASATASPELESMNSASTVGSSAPSSGKKKLFSKDGSKGKCKDKIDALSKSLASKQAQQKIVVNLKQKHRFGKNEAVGSYELPMANLQCVFGGHMNDKNISLKNGKNETMARLRMSIDIINK